MKIRDDLGYSSGGGYSGGFNASGPAAPAPPARPNARAEELYISDEYKIFMVVGTYDQTTGGNHHITIRPFHSMPAENVEKMRAIAKPWSEEKRAGTDITIRTDSTDLSVIDGYSGISSKFPIAELDPDVRAKLDPSGAVRDDGLWQKYLVAASTAADPQVTTTCAVAVRKPLTLKRSP